MELEARGLLDAVSEGVVRDTTAAIVDAYDDYPPRIQYVLVVERAKGILTGLYVMWANYNNDGDTADDANKVIHELIASYHRAIADAVGYNPKNKSGSKDTGDTRVYDP